MSELISGKEALADTEFYQVVGFEGFIEISKCGKIKTLKRNGTPEKMMTPRVGTNGYLKVVFRINGKQYTKNIHRLLALNFLKNTENLPCVNHIDGCKTNNSLGNLEWCTYSRNVKHSYDIGLSKPNTGARSTGLKESDVLDIVLMKNNGFTLKSIAEKFKISASSVSDIALGRTWNHVTCIEFSEYKRGARRNQTSCCGITEYIQ